MAVEADLRCLEGLREPFCCAALDVRGGVHSFFCDGSGEAGIMLPQAANLCIHLVEVVDAVDLLGF